MEITKKVQLLSKSLTNNDLFQYDFLDLESNLPFSVYTKEKSKFYEDLKQYSPTDTKFQLVLAKITKDKNTIIAWKIKGV